MKTIQPDFVQLPPEQQKGDPILGALGTFLPMAFGLPPMPMIGQMLSGGPSIGTMAGGVMNPFMGGFGIGGFSGGQINPFASPSSPIWPTGFRGPDPFPDDRSMDQWVNPFLQLM